MKLVIIDKKDIVLKLENNSVKINEQTIPFKLIDLLVLNHKVKLDSGDILKLTKNDISILFIAYNNEHTALVSSSTTKAGDLKLAQYKSLKNKLRFAKHFIYKKIVLHNEHLEKLDIKININETLEKVLNANKIDELMGIEGTFARLYFKHYFEKLPKNMHKSKRSKNPPQDPVNAVLSYWYSLYYNIISVKLLSHGFEPSCGYLHTPFRTHNALASDFMELFRAQISQAVYSLFKNKLLLTEDFSKKGGVYLKYDGRKKYGKNLYR